MQTPILSLFFSFAFKCLTAFEIWYFMKRIVLTGGGTAGHVTPNIALMPKPRELGYDIQYIGSYDGIEKKLIEELGVPYYGISSGKLRRYFDMKNFTDPFRVVKGFFQAKSQLKKLKPTSFFRKADLSQFPCRAGCKTLHIPVIIHESDMTPGLANKLAIPAATKCQQFRRRFRIFLPEKLLLQALRSALSFAPAPRRSQNSAISPSTNRYF